MFEKLDILLKDSLNKFSPREREIVSQRFSLQGEKETLEKIGRKYKISRERVRQIEKSCLKQLKQIIEKQNLDEQIKPIKNHLISCGGVREYNLLMNDLKFLSENWPEHFEQKLKFIFFLKNEPKYFAENKEFHSFWYLDEKTKNKILKEIKKFKDFCEKKRKIFEKAYLNYIKDVSFINYLALSKYFVINPFGNLGLKHWPEIQPQKINDKVYLVLKELKKPIHFQEITQLINQYKFDQKIAFVQTVHNELIKDQRFVLVGRGIYGLKEHGFEQGTVKEIIEKILEKNSPLAKQKIIALVQKQRIVTENTIILNLSNTSFFKKLADGRYVLIKEK